MPMCVWYTRAERGLLSAAASRYLGEKGVAVADIAMRSTSQGSSRRSGSQAVSETSSNGAHPRRPRGSDGGMEGASNASIPRHKPLGSAERTVEDRQLQDVMQYELQRKALQRLQATCPFRPHINATSSTAAPKPEQSRTKPKSQSSDGKRPVDTAASPDTENAFTVEERLLMKAKAAAMIRNEKEMLRKKAEEDAMKTLFRPQLNRDDPYRKRLLHPPDLPVEERLLHYGKTVHESRKQLSEDKEALERKQMLEFFRPSTTASTPAGRKKQHTFLTRATTRQNDRDKAMVEARAAQAKEYTFQPSISRLSQQLSEEQRRAGGSGAQTDRSAALHAEARRRQREKEVREREQAAMEADRRAYHPTTNPTSDQWIRRSQHRQLFEGRDFVERQDEYARVHSEHCDLLKRAREEEEHLALEAERATTHLRRVQKEMIDQQVNRLYREQQEVSKEVKERLADQLLQEECPFRPTISVGSEYVARRIHRGKDVIDRLTEWAKRAKARMAASSTPSQDTSTQSNSRPQKEGSSRAKVVSESEAHEFYLRQVEAVERAQETIAKKQSRRQLEEQLECTFRPKTNGTPRSATPPKGGKSDQSFQSESVTSVQGVSSFLKRRELAKRQAEERAQRVEALGKGLPCNGPNYTVLVPFKLSDRKPVIRSSTTHDGSTAGLDGSPRSQQQQHFGTSPTRATKRWVVEEAVHHTRRASAGHAQTRRMLSSSLHDDRVPTVGHQDPYNSERLLAAIQRYVPKLA